MKFFVFFFYLFCVFNYTISSVVQTVRDIYDVAFKDEKTKSDEYIKNNIKTEKMKTIMKAFFEYKSGFHIVPTLVIFEKPDEIQNLKKNFKDCLKSNLHCSNNQSIAVATILIENFFLKIFNLEKVNLTVVSTQEKYERDLSEFIEIISACISNNLGTILDEMSKLRNNNILTGKIVLENYTPLKEDYEKTKKQLLEFSKQENQKKIIGYLKNDFEFFKKIFKSCILYGENIFTDNKEKISYKKMKSQLQDLFNEKKILNKKEVIKELKAFISLVKQISEKIKDKDEESYDFLKIFYSSVLDFSMFKDESSFLNYFIKCYYASCFERNILNDTFDYQKIIVLKEIFPLKESFFILKKKYFSKNLKSLMLIKEKNTSDLDKKNKQLTELNFNKDPFFSLLIENIKKFDFDTETFLEKNTDLSNVVTGLTFAQKKDNYIANNYKDFYENNVKKFFLDKLFFLSHEQDKFSKLQDNRWFKSFRQNQSVDLISKEDFIFEEKLIQDLNKKFQENVKVYNEKFNLYENFLKDVSLAISVFFLKDWYRPYHRAMYYLDQNKKKTLLFGTLLGGLALLYTYQDKKLPQFIIQKSREFIPFLKKYLSLFKQKFLSGISKQKSSIETLVLC